MASHGQLRAPQPATDHRDPPRAMIPDGPAVGQAIARSVAHWYRGLRAATVLSNLTLSILSRYRLKSKEHSHERKTNQKETKKRRKRGERPPAGKKIEVLVSFGVGFVSSRSLWAGKQ